MKKAEDRPLEIIFAERLKEAMSDSGFMPIDVEANDVVTASMLHAYTHGKRLPQLRTAARLADFLGVSLDWLCGADMDDEEYDSETALRTNDNYQGASVDYTSFSKRKGE